jgi:peptide-methionine (R)-S-oxide reductase
MERRKFIATVLGALGFAAASLLLNAGKAFAAEVASKILKTNDEWKKVLTPKQYDVLREEGTERPFTSQLLGEHCDGIFACVACDLPLFTSATKFDSGTGWPSFFEAIPDHIDTTTDHKLIYTRTEYHLRAVTAMCFMTAHNPLACVTVRMAPH